MIYRYRAHGLTLASPFPIPEFPPTEDPGPDEVTVELGSVPERLPDPSRAGALAQAGGGSYLLRVPGVAAYHIPSSSRIVVDPAPDASPADVRAFLLAAVMGAHVHARGLLPLHASAVRAAGGCVLLAGPSGSGKSTLAARLVGAGYPLWGEDLTTVALASDGTPMAHSGARVLPLAQPTAEPADRPSHPLPVLRIYLLGHRGHEAISFRDLRGAERMLGVLRETTRPHLARPVGHPLAHFGIAASVAKAAEVFELRHRYHLPELDRLVAALTAHLADAGLSPPGGSPC